MGAQKLGPRVAIIQNFPDSKPAWAADMIASFDNLIKQSAPNSAMEVFNAVLGEELPEAASFDIIFLTGGTYNLAQEKVEPWVEREMEWIRQMATSAPETRLVGICWGHQAISRALGGSVEFVPNTHVVGKKPEQLTKAGRCLFNASSPDLVHFRMRRVAQPGSGSVALAADNSMLFYPARNIITIQGHPEFTGSVSHGVLAASGDAFTKNMDEDELSRTLKSFDEANDGESIFAVIMEWALGRREIVV